VESHKQKQGERTQRQEAHHRGEAFVAHWHDVHDHGQREEDDAVQESWLRLSRSGSAEIEDLGAWLTVVTSRIAPLVGASDQAARQLASRARRRVRRARVEPDPELPRQREVVDAFLAAARAGDFDGLLRVLDPECVLRVDAGPHSQTVRGGDEVAGQAVRFSSPTQVEEDVLVNGAAGVLVGHGGRVRSLTAFTVVEGRITAMDILADPERLAALAVRE
jgi:hypothetical protein